MQPRSHLLLFLAVCSPHVAAGSFIRSAHPRLLDAEQEARSPRHTPTGAAAAAAARHLRHAESRGTANEGERLLQLMKQQSLLLPWAVTGLPAVGIHPCSSTASHAPPPHIYCLCADTQRTIFVTPSSAGHTAPLRVLLASLNLQLPPRSRTSEDLEEALLFEFEADEASSLTPKHTVVTSSLVSAAASAGSLGGPAGSLPSVLSGVRSVTKDSTGTHVLTENFTLHIEEVRGSNKKKCCGMCLPV